MLAGTCWGGDTQSGRSQPRMPATIIAAKRGNDAYLTAAMVGSLDDAEDAPKVTSRLGPGGAAREARLPSRETQFQMVASSEGRAGCWAQGQLL